MNVYPNISYIAKLIAEPTRAIILECLMNNQALPASELAYMAKVSHPTISSHLSKLVEGNLLKVEQHGRHRYYRLANQEVAEVLEKLGTIAPAVQVRSLKQSDQLKQIRYARTCYDHLAGRLGVEITEKLLDKEFIILEKGEYIVTEQGKRWFLNFGINIETANIKRRVFAKPCLDWSERRYHISGWLGSAIAKLFFEQEWITKTDKNRAVHLTQKGIKLLKDQLGIDMEDKKVHQNTVPPVE
ncbi:metalloregulator ArsR/SmtB family transcription factor [Bacillus pacificus]|uniref:ArsR/SmtB family transcription factor n=1 Tax=Bacillus TaxID=1386 RepID=UPI00034B5BE1|nr:metalloregulator ArsR/SmtB family transcription factor [Bacillus pacificus]MCC2389224.1 metalloregulator ArsR/SmtB family transcription factor [Bacillus pacificus]MCC2417314.1 metalloregulator ArsR/SmtB family transcription factor [Bacillus pacificus]MCC2472961.1 metalloregulator ArsR/SmtB family transcription factor [Bacillus pacificus]MCU5006539.1 metalloregulator ArsR/SmtB family transcription factor [Bacillus pacificus]MCU5257016.1 metalloregulator ArsR/SmtB family transcription factor 